ncbi:Hypothetical predicted protein [Octopus vulgaris]|uniref:Uncharacterized protein n=1 Tax=Octopus vulgaris TaxID=6645 RepID=A0AA36F2J6_OCTVU|nr:Hypothetical predicted protein [Octopus vulgaris]
MDSNIERFARIERMADDMFRAYREVYEEKQAIQTRLTMFIKKPTPATSTVAPADDIEDPQPSTIDFYLFLKQSHQRPTSDMRQSYDEAMMKN